MDRAVEVVAGVGREPERDRRPDGRPARPRLDQRATEPGEVAALRGGPLGEGHRGRIHERIAHLLAAALPDDREVHAHPLEDPADEPVIARAGDLGLRGDGDPTRVRRGHDQRRGGRMQLDGELGLALLADRALHGPDGLGERRPQPRLGVGEEDVGGRDPGDQAPASGLTGEPRMEGADEHGRHGSSDLTPGRRPVEHAVGTSTAAPRVRGHPRHPSQKWAGSISEQSGRDWTFAL